MSNYATKTNLTNATGVDTLSFAKKVDLSNLKSNVEKLDIDKIKNVATNFSNLKSKLDKLDVDKLSPVPAADISKLSDVVKNDVVNISIYLMYIYVYIYICVKIKNIEDEIPDITNLAIKLLLMLLKIKYLVIVI